MIDVDLERPYADAWASHEEYQEEYAQEISFVDDVNAMLADIADVVIRHCLTMSNSEASNKASRKALALDFIDSIHAALAESVESSVDSEVWEKEEGLNMATINDKLGAL